MHPTDPKPLSHYFHEGLDARADGKTRHDNPYSAGSQQRREWNAGFCATVDEEDDEKLQLDPNENAPVRTSD